MSLATTTWTVAAVVAAAGLALFSYDQSHRYVGASAAANHDDTPINACELLTANEVAGVVGAEVTSGERRDEGDVGGRGTAPPGTYSSACFWRFRADVGRTPDPSLPLHGMRFVILQAMTWPTRESASNFLTEFRSAFEQRIIPSAPVAVEDLGDEALWWGDGMAVRAGATSIGVSVFLQNGDKTLQRRMEEALARKIISRVE